MALLTAFLDQLLSQHLVGHIEVLVLVRVKIQVIQQVGRARIRFLMGFLLLWGYWVVFSCGLHYVRAEHHGVRHLPRTKFTITVDMR